MAEAETIVLRSLQPNDVNFIYSTFLRGLYYGNDFYSEIEKKAYFNTYEQVLTRILSKTHLTPVIACLASDPDIILGYALIEALKPSNDVLHWVYVKDAWRKQGIAKKMLMGRNIAAVTHITKVGNDIRKKQNWSFNPFL